MKIVAAAKRISCCAFWPHKDGHTVDPDWGFAQGGELVCLGASATFDWIVQSWECHWAYATLCTQNCGRTSYSSNIAYNDDVSRLNLKEVYVEGKDSNWAEGFWTIYEGEDCKGRSAILPV